LRRTNTGFPVSSCKKGFGLTGETYETKEEVGKGREGRIVEQGIHTEDMIVVWIEHADL